MIAPQHIYYFFFFNDTATTEIYTLSLHDALPIFPPGLRGRSRRTPRARDRRCRKRGGRGFGRRRRTAGSGGGSPTPRRRGDGALALELEQVGDDAVGDRARDLVLAKARSEKRAVGAIRGEPGLDENGGAPGPGGHPGNPPPPPPDPPRGEPGPRVPAPP